MPPLVGNFILPRTQKAIERCPFGKPGWLQFRDYLSAKELITGAATL